MLSSLFALTFGLILALFKVTVLGLKNDPNGPNLVGYCFSDGACTQGKSDLRANVTADHFALTPGDQQACVGFEAVKDKKGSICYQTACYDCETFIPANACYKTRDGLDWGQYCQ